MNDMLPQTNNHQFAKIDPFSGETEYEPDAIEWRDADALGDPDHEYELVQDREWGV